MFNVIRKHLTPSPAAKTGFSSLLVPVTAGAVPLKVLLVPLTTGAAPLSTLFAPLNTGPVFPATVFIVSLTALYVLTPTATVQAAVTHEFLPGPSAEITKGAPEGQPLPGPVSGLNAMTVDAGHLFLAEKVEDGSGHVRLDEFDDSTGAFVRQFPQDPSLSSLDAGVAVAHASGDVYDAGAAGVAVFGAAGELKATWKGETAGAPFGSLLGVGVDNSTGHWSEGDVLVLNGGEKAVDVLKPEAGGEEPNKLAVPPLTGTCETPGENAEGPTPCPLSKPVPFTEPLAMSVSATNGGLLVADEHEGNIDVVDVFEPAGLDELVFARELTGTPNGAWEASGSLPVPRKATRIAAGVGGDIYVAEEVGNTEGGVEKFVDQFDSSGKYLGRLAGPEPLVPFHGLNSIAVDPATGRLFVGNSNPEQGTGAVDVFGPSIVVPDVETEAASAVKAHEATLNGTVNPDGEGKATCAFLWGTTPQFANTASCVSPVAEGSSPVPVAVTLSGLQPDTTYFYRLQAANHNGANPGEPVQTREFTTPGPGIHSTSAASVTADTALLQAVIDPHGASTTFHFEYDTGPYAEGEPHHGTSLPVPDRALGSGEGDLEVLQPLAGLTPGTTYHYRVVARSELQPGVFEEFDGPDQTFITQTGGATGLPDGRAWELVSPPNKHGAALIGITSSTSGGFIQAAAGGSSIVYRANLSVTGQPQGNIDQMHVLAKRGPGGWSSTDLEVPHLASTQIAALQEYSFFSSDLSRGVLQPFGSFDPSLSPLATEQTPYLRDSATGIFTPIVTAANDTTEPFLPFGEEVDGECQGTVCGPTFVDGTPDLSYAVLGERLIAGVVPLLAGAAERSLYEWSSQTGALSLVSELPGNAGSVAGTLGPRYEHAISDDGSRVFWNSFGGELYMRDMPRGETIQIGTGPQFFEGANAAGTIVFYSHHECEVTLGSGELECWPLGEDGLLLGASEDGSWVYFEKAGGLFVRHAGATKLVAGEVGTIRGDGTSSGEPLPQADPWRVSPDGEWLAFMSDRPLTGYDNRDATSGQRDEEVYLYDAAAERLICASCNPTGARPRGTPWEERPLAGDRIGWPAGTTIAASIPGWGANSNEFALYQPRSLSDSGRLFFDSSDGLVPRDSNAQSDVYEFEPAGDGSCTASTASGSVSYVAASGGCVGLISSGTSALESAFLDASESGNDVFFLTAEKLSPRDPDSAYDLYDARVGGQESTGEIKPVECQGDACQQPVAPPDDATPASLAGAGTGNLVAPTPVVVKPKAKTTAQIRAGKLAKALKACRRDKSKKRRSTCEKRARRTYGKGK